MASRRNAMHRSGFTLIEMLVTMGIVMILIALAMPSMGKVKGRAREIQSLSRIRQLGLLVVQYAGENDDRVPAIFPPEYIEPGNPPDWLEVELDGQLFSGAWFTNGQDGFYALNPPPPPGVMRAPGSLDLDPITVHGEPTSHFTDYLIADCYYATPNYWHNDERQTGPKQWSLQALSDARYPSQKGFMRQGMVYDGRGAISADGGVPTGLYSDTKSSVLWADQSASQEFQALLKPGVPNRFYHFESGFIEPIGLGTGHTINNTKDGVAGRDRE